MKKLITLMFLSILFFVLDNSLMPFLQIKGYHPSLLFVFIICYAIVADSWNGIFVGIFAGFLQDIYFCNALGINMLLNMLMCLIANKIGQGIFKDRVIIPIISNFFISILKGILIFCILYVLKQYTDVKLVLYTSIYNFVIAIFMYKKVYKLCQKEFMIKNWKF